MKNSWKKETSKWKANYVYVTEIIDIVLTFYTTRFLNVVAFNLFFNFEAFVFFFFHFYTCVYERIYVPRRIPFWWICVFGVHQKLKANTSNTAPNKSDNSKKNKRNNVINVIYREFLIAFIRSAQAKSYHLLWFLIQKMV